MWADRLGVQVPAEELEQWQQVLAGLPFQSWEETNNPAYQLFLA